MALHSFAAAVLLLVVVLVSCLLPPAVEAGSVHISTYWGTSCAEGRLIDACNTNLYSIVNIGFAEKFGRRRRPTLNISGHCGPYAGGCKYLGAEIQACQDLGIKVFISIGGPGGNYSLAYEYDATIVANYLWGAYLGGKGSRYDRPFGDDAILDGVDFFIEGSTTLYWDVLAEALKNLSSGTQMELSATPKCQYPDHHLGAAIETGLFDYAQVRFYDKAGCQYNGSFDGMKTAWDEWTAKARVDKIYVGVTASEEEEGYVDPDVLVSDFLLDAEDSPKFGGLMVWNLYTDLNSGYSKRIKDLNSAIQTAPSGVEVE